MSFRDINNKSFVYHKKKILVSSLKVSYVFAILLHIFKILKSVTSEIWTLCAGYVIQYNWLTIVLSRISPLIDRMIILTIILQRLKKYFSIFLQFILVVVLIENKTNILIFKKKVLLMICKKDQGKNIFVYCKPSCVEKFHFSVK